MRPLHKKDLDENIVNVMMISDRVLVIKILSDPVDTLIIQVYMPTSDADLFKHLRSTVKWNGSRMEEIKCRISILGKTAFEKVNALKQQEGFQLG